jgi:hypothetical protein
MLWIDLAHPITRGVGEREEGILQTRLGPSVQLGLGEVEMVGQPIRA